MNGQGGTVTKPDAGSEGGQIARFNPHVHLHHLLDRVCQMKYLKVCRNIFQDIVRVRHGCQLVGVTSDKVPILSHFYIFWCSHNLEPTRFACVSAIRYLIEKDGQFKPKSGRKEPG
jgi:hypothetical protein